MTYQVNKGSPHQCCNELCSILIFLYKKINHTRHRSSLFAKRHARLACSLASVLTDGSLPLPPFGDYDCDANISMVRISHRRNGLRSIPIFYFIKNQSARSTVPPFPQKVTHGRTEAYHSVSSARENCAERAYSSFQHQNMRFDASCEMQQIRHSCSLAGALTTLRLATDLFRAAQV